MSYHVTQFTRFGTRTGGFRDLVFFLQRCGMHERVDTKVLFPDGIPSILKNRLDCAQGMVCDVSPKIRVVC